MIQASSAPSFSLRDATRVTAISLLLLAALAVAVALLRGENYAIAVLAGVVFLIAGAWRYWLLPLLYLAFMTMLPHLGDTAEYPVYYHINTFIPCFIAMVLLLLADQALDPNKIWVKRPASDNLGIAVALFLGWTIFTYLRGMAIGNDWRYMWWEISFVSMFFSYFYWRAMFRKHGNIILWNWLLLAFAIGAAIELTVHIAITFTDVLSFVLNRYLNRQPQITMFSVPMALVLFLTRKSLHGRIFAIVVTLLAALHVFLSQQRALWLAAVIISFTFFTLYVFRKGFKLKTLLFWAVLSLVLAGFFAGVLFTATWFFHTDLTVLLQRWKDVRNLSDDSFLIRLYDLRKAIHDVGPHWFLGLGGGRLNNWVMSGWRFFYFDNSYGIAYFKGGIPLMLTMTAIYSGLWIRGIQLYASRGTKTEKLYGISIASTTTGLMFVGGFNSGLLFYPYIFVWMMLAASATVLLEKIRERQQLEAGI